MRSNRDGATAIEYAMVAFFISIAAFSAVVTIGSDVSGLFSRIASSF
jgi:Flp pilus assembly pilin Flp